MALIKQKYRLLFSAKLKRKPGPKGPSKELINLIIDMKKRKLRYGYLRKGSELKTKNIF